MKNNLSFKDFEIKGYLEEAGGFFIEGMAAAFGVPDMEPNKWGQFDIIHKGAFAKTIKENKDRIKIVMNHDLKKAVGRPVLFEEREEGLYMKALISESETDLQQKIREGIFSELSIGFVPVKASIRYQAMPDGSDIRDLFEVKLWEVSIVTIAKNEYTRFAEAKGMEVTGKIEQMFDELINEEPNEEKKYSLLMLKSLALEPQEALKPPKESIFSKLSFTNKN